MRRVFATLIAFGADRIYMSRTSELGPVDPQVRYKTDAGAITPISADEYIIELVDFDSPRWELTWELYVRCDWKVKSDYAALLETKQSSFGRGREAG
jgi:hypothetical protein